MITLGIIGVVASLTMPALIANHKKQEVVTKLKKVYSVMNQAINASVAEYGDVESWAMDCGQSGSSTCSTDETIVWYNTYIGKHLQIASLEKDKDVFRIYLNDGGILEVTNYIYDMGFYVNKKALLNKKAGVNHFAFRFNPVLVTGQEESVNKYTVKPTFEPYTYSWDGTREKLLKNGNKYGCAEEYHAFCAKLIQYEGWQIPKDYPLRF